MDIVRANAGKKDKGLTLEEVETAEGGVVRESAVGMAQTKRAARRKGKQAAAAGASRSVFHRAGAWCNAAPRQTLLGTHDNATCPKCSATLASRLTMTGMCAAQLDGP